MVQVKPGVQERILLHLWDYADYSDKVEVPFALSQMGIANAVAIARSNVPRAIAGLKDQGLLVERQAHVSGVTRKRKAYFLTEVGMKLAEETWERLSEHPVRLMLQDGASESTTLAGSVEESPFPIRPTDVLRYLDEKGVLDMRNLTPDLIERDLSKHVEKQLVSVLGDLPRMRHFVGRDTELKTMVDLLDARSTTILVPGIAGIGKTSLAAKLVEMFTHKRNLLYHRVQDWEGARAFLEVAAEWLSAIGDDGLADYLATTPVPSAPMSVNLIVNGLANASALIVIDDLHKLGDEVLFSVIRGLARRMEEVDDVGLVMFSRSFRPVLPLTDAEGNIMTLVVPLEGLDSISSRELLTALPDLDEVTYLHIYGLSRGHPLVLELINRGSIGETFHETLETYVEQEIFSKLSGGEKRLLGALAVFREPMPLEALTVQDLDIDLLDDLVDKGLARQADSENYDVHDLVREFLSRSLDEQTQRDLHAAAVEWYRNRRTEPAHKIEFLYHLRYTGDSEELGAEIATTGSELVASGHMELLGILDGVEQSDVEDSAWAVVLELRADILSLQGRWEEAGDLYTEAVALLENSDAGKLPTARILSSQADINMMRGDIETALEMHREALEQFIELGDAVGAARTYNNMGYIYRRQKDQRRALETCENVEVLLESEDDPSLADARIKLAAALLEMDELERAREHAMVAHAETLETGDMSLHARARAVLGRFYARSDDPELALHHYSEALEQMSEEADQHSAVEIKLLLGEVLVDAGRWEEALEQYREALALAESNDYRVLIGELLARLGEAAQEREHRMEYLQRSLSVFRELGAQDRMREVQAKVHRALMGE